MLVVGDREAEDGTVVACAATARATSAAWPSSALAERLHSAADGLIDRGYTRAR